MLKLIHADKVYSNSLNKVCAIKSNVKIHVCLQISIKLLYLCSSRMSPLLHWSSLLAEPCCKFKHTKSDTHHSVIPLSVLCIYILGNCVCESCNLDDG